MISATPRSKSYAPAGWISATSGLWRQPVPEPAGLLYRRLGLGQVSRRRSDRKGRRRGCLNLEPSDPEFNAGDGQERRQLYELAIDQDGGAAQRLLGRNRAR